MDNRTHTAQTTYYGIDVSKEELVVSRLLDDGKYELQSFANTEVGIATFVDALGEVCCPFVTLEATGNYSMKLTFALGMAHIPLALLNPKQSKGFIAGVMLSTSKTDAKDACALALYGKVNRPDTYQLPDDKVLEVKQLRVLLRQLKKQAVMIANQLHAISFHAQPLAFVLHMLEQNQQRLQEQIKQVEQQLCQLSEAHFEQLYQLALTIKGIGPATATALLTITNGCTGFDNAKQLAKFIGVCPTQNESGISIRSRGAMAKTGEGEIRALLYMGARSAKRYNLACKDLYDRLRTKGKCHKVAMNAVCHKLVKQFFAVITKQQAFDNEWHLKDKKA